MSKKHTIRKIILVSSVLTAIYSALKVIAYRTLEPESIDNDNPYRNPEAEIGKPKTIYEKKIKPILDQIVSFAGLVVLAPVLGIISLMVYLDDPGPVFFKQKRVGKDKHFFMLHKYRTMKVFTPHNTPTHQLLNPEQYLTRFGKFLRRTSLDELPQIWDIFRGKMSIIGPRPALFNQDDLVKYRERYGANNLYPGLTGWAQISGRDELEISKKAEIDGAYAVCLRTGSWKGFWGDMVCFFGTIYSVFCQTGIVEGGTGEIKKAENHLFTETFPVKSKRILITGDGSYIGECVRKYLEAASSEYYNVDIKSTVGFIPEPSIFYGYDVVFNVAGVAHVSETNENRELYYKVNRDLAIAIARAAKKAGSEQFILLSSMAVYGMSEGCISKETVPYPNSAYGESKLAADEAIEKLADENFHVTILRPPMVYGRGCRGNYQALRKFAIKSPVFPACRNKRSMIFIGNLCEFVKRVIDMEESGLFFPQNEEYVNTTQMVESIARLNKKKIKKLHIFTPFLRVVPISFIKKVFGDLTYEKVDLVNKYSFEESMELTELWKEKS